MSSETVSNQTSAVQSEPARQEARVYQRQKLYAALAALLVNLLVIAVLALVVGPLLDVPLRQWLGDSRWLRLLVVGGVVAVCLEITSLPIDFWSSYVLEHRYGLSRQTLGRWVLRRLKAYLIMVPLGVGILCGVYAMIWACGHWWWLLATLGWLALTLVLGQLVPVVILPLFYRVIRMEDSPLLANLRRLAEGTGLKVEGIYRLELSAETRKANAALAGLGRTRRVLLGDTLLDQFTPEEIEVVFAHEVGHHVHRHLLKMIALQVVVTTVGLFLVDRILVALAGVLHYQGTGTLAAWQDPSALPLVMLILAVFAIVMMPLHNAVSRAFERQSDRYALERTGMAAAYRSAFGKLGVLNKIDPDPPALAVWLLDDHPPLSERLALADRAIGELS